MTCSNFSCRCLSAWIASILLNLAFIGGIVGWSLAKIWPVALGLSTLYIVVLVLWIRRFHKALQNNDDSAGGVNACTDEPAGECDAESSTTSNSSAHQESESQRQSGELGELPCRADQVETSRSLSPKAIPMALSLLYALFVFALATPGTILTLKAMCHRYYDHDEISRRRYWATDYEKLPTAVRSWDESYDFWDIEQAGTAMFCQLGDTTYFSGEGKLSLKDQKRPSLFATSSTTPARQVGNFSEPAWLTKVTNTTCCFYENTFDTIICGNEYHGFVELPPSSDDGSGITVLLTEIGGLLWFWRYDLYSDTHAIVSVNVTTMEITEYSERHEESAEIDKTSNKYEEECDEISRGNVIRGMFLVAIPVTLVSIWLWAKKGIPSSSFTLYVGLGLICLFFPGVFETDFSMGIVGFIIWFVLGTPIWILASAFVLAVNKKAQRGGVVAWGLYSIASFAFPFAFLLLRFVVINTGGNDYTVEVVGWFLLTVFFLMPLVLVGIVVKSTYLYALGFLGIMVIASIATLRLSHLGVATTVSLVVLVDLVLIFIGWCIHRKRPKLHEKMVSSLARCAGHTSEEIDGEEDTGLLLNAEATAA